jgi:hypothetical protein
MFFSPNCQMLKNIVKLDLSASRKSHHFMILSRLQTYVGEYIENTLNRLICNLYTYFAVIDVKKTTVF